MDQKNKMIEGAATKTKIRASNRLIASIQTLTSCRFPGFRYHLYTPSYGGQGLPVLVAVHGISHRAKEQARAFAQLAEQKGFVLIAPLFCRKNFPAYQRLGVSQKNVPCYPDEALNILLEEIAEQKGFNTQKVYLFGYSAGGQFAHRYAMMYPEKVYSVATGAAGWYTFPDRQISFPRGLRTRTGFRGIELDPQRFLQVPMASFVGEKDVYQDSTFRRSFDLDAQQGLSRVERGARWIQAMREAAGVLGFQTRYQFYVLRACGHSFIECVENGGMALQAVDFLFNKTELQASRSSAMTILSGASEFSRNSSFLYKWRV